MFSRSSLPIVRTQRLCSTRATATYTSQLSYIRPENMGYLGSEDVDSRGVHLRRRSKLDGQFTLLYFHPLYAGRLCSVGRDYDQRHLH